MLPFIEKLFHFFYGRTKLNIKIEQLKYLEKHSILEQFLSNKIKHNIQLIKLE